MAKAKLNIDALVDITLAVERKVRATYEREKEQLTDELDAVRDERDALTGECYEYEKRTHDLEVQVEELTGQKDRQAATVRELMETRDRQKTLIDDLEKHADSLEKELEDWRMGMPPHTDEELQKKLDKAMDHIRRQGEEIDKLRAGAADPRWIPMSEKRPCGGATVIVCTKRGVVDVATETVDGWKRSTGKIAEPVAWMPLPVRYTGGEA